MANLEELFSRRTTLVNRLKLAETFCSNYIAARDRDQLKMRISSILETAREFDRVQQKIINITADADKKEEELDTHGNFEERCFMLQAKLNEKLEANIAHTDARSTVTNIRLPAIQLTEFSGEDMEWLAFRDTYVALIHENGELTDIHKFHYLRASLKGEAAKLIESIPLAATNYQIAWQAITERYSNEYLLKKRHLQAMFDIRQVKTEGTASLHKLVDEFDRHRKIVHQLGEATDEWSTILEYLLCTKLPDDTLKLWEDYASTVEDHRYGNLIDFLQRRMRILESISMNHATEERPRAKATTTHFSSYPSVVDATKICIRCRQGHLLSECPVFHNLSPIDRRQFVSEKKLCYNCLRTGHIRRSCFSKHSCRHCKSKHHTLLHIEEANRPPNTPSDLRVINAVAETGKRKQVFLLTAIVKIVDNFGIEHPARALIDSGSQPNLMSQRLARILRIRSARTDVSIQGVSGNSGTVRESVTAEIRSKLGDFNRNMNFLVISKFPAELPTQFVSTEGWKIPRHIVLADPEFNKPQSVDLIIGIEHYLSLFPGTARLHLGPELPQLVDSVFGWMVAGSAPVESSRVDTTSTITVCASITTLEESIERFWKAEQLQVKDGYSPEERRCEQLYAASTDRDETGRYIVRLPRHPDFEARLGGSRAGALRRFELLEKRLDKDCALKAEYHQFMLEYLQLGRMRLVDDGEVEPATAYYLPYHPVFKESSTTTKMRVVFDGSSKTSSGYSLNDALCKGPVVQDELLDLLLRFRTYEVALVGDIEKMYRQVNLHSDDRSLVRIFFRFSPNDPVQIYELCTVTYGLAPSSFLATRTLLQLADDEGGAYPVADRALRTNFYVDDFIGGAESIEEATKLRTELSTLLAKGGFDLRKWTSNRLEVLDGLSEDHLGTKSSLHFDSHETVKALGVSWKTFVANRVSEIQHFTDGHVWNHIAGVENPADIVSRGLSVTEFLSSSVWREGPAWLSLHRNNWPISQPAEIEDSAILERMTTVLTIHEAASCNEIFLRWSEYRRLISRVAYCLRFIRKTRNRSRGISTMFDRSESSLEVLTVEELAEADDCLIRLAQRDAFSTEIKELEKSKQVRKQSALRRLTPFLDEKGIMRVGGRLNLARLPFQAKHPALLPKDHPFPRLIAEHQHQLLLHGGGRLLLSAIREKYWPLQGRILVKSVVRRCFRCARSQPVPAQQQMGQLPSCRVTPGRPFAVTGVDYAGPIYLKPAHRRAAALKAYICVFVCFTTKAVHLELVGDLSTQGFLAALRRFTCRRGLPEHLHSDNGKNFEGARNELLELFERFNNEQEQSHISTACAEQGITWHMIPPRAPHFGGLWEAAVKTAKRHLYRQLGSTRLTYEGYITVLDQIEAAMNSRPLLPMSDDPNDLAVLTPSHFLIGTKITTIPDPSAQHLKSSPLEHLQKLQLIVQRFWSHWRTEYLQEMQREARTIAKNEDFVPGRMVILVDELLPTARWPLARIIDVCPGKDGLVRVVLLKTAKSVVKRPITKICMLPNGE